MHGARATPHSPHTFVGVGYACGGVDGGAALFRREVGRDMKSGFDLDWTLTPDHPELEKSDELVS